MYTRLRKSLDEKNDKGFTLIELLVVIIIIGILAAIAIPIFLSQRKKGFEASQKSDARSIATQMETFYTDAQVYPSALNGDNGRVTFTTAIADDLEEYVVLSPNNTAEVYRATAAGGGFCVLVSNVNTDNTAVYDSENGGLQDMQPTDTAACSAAFAGTNIVTGTPADPAP